jgi:FixJ family two-component response regulator
MRNPLKPCWVFIVDDDIAVRNALANLLESAGLSVDVFGSAEEFLHSSAAHDRSCLILDVQLPFMSGLELQRRLSSNRNSAPIIFVTAHVDDVLRARALREGAVGFFYKPINSDALLSAVHSALE